MSQGVGPLLLLLLIPLAAGEVSHEELQALEDELEHELQARHYVNEWAVRIEGGDEVVDQIARDLGYHNKGRIGTLENHYRLIKRDHPSRSKRSADHHTRALQGDHRVAWVEQQFSKQRVKRDFISKRDEDEAYTRVSYNDKNWLTQWYLGRRSVSGEFPAPLSFPEVCRDVNSVPNRRRRAITRAEYEEAYTEAGAAMFNDPEWICQFYLYDARQPNSTLPKLDLHVIPVWSKNITGKGVVVTVLDDGLEWNHTDISPNYDKDASWDYNSEESESGDDDPTPRYDSKNFNKHGTRCAGEIAMVANNQKCGVGVAYNAKIGGIRMLDGTVTDRLEAEALSHNHKHIDIYSASWGPNDDGKTLEGPGTLARAAMEEAITKGRDGKGVIYVWASGNGGSSKDNCNCDGYTGSIYTLSISSASQGLTSPWYAEPCASTFATTFSSGTMSELRITTTDLRDTCTTAHTGTSASAPLAAGIVALLLEANPDLTWRDVQHLVAWTSDPFLLACENEDHKDSDDPDYLCQFTTNKAGFRTNNHFGFGMLNAVGLVNASLNFPHVPKKSEICYVDGKTVSKDIPVELSSEQKVVVSVETTGCKGQDAEVNYLEHVEVIIDMQYSRRGDVEILLTSPQGTKTTLLTRRTRDVSSEGFPNWSFMSVHTWGENPVGTWQITIQDRFAKEVPNHGVINNVQLRLHGTKTMPEHVSKAGGERLYVDLDAALEDSFEKEEVPQTTREKFQEELNKLASYLQLHPESKTENETPTPALSFESIDNTNSIIANENSEIFAEEINQLADDLNYQPEYPEELSSYEATDPIFDQNELTSNIQDVSNDEYDNYIPNLDLYAYENGIAPDYADEFNRIASEWKRRG